MIGAKSNMNNLFYYLNFPKLPSDLEDLALENIDNVYLDDYKEVNQKEVYGTMIARVPEKVYTWIDENILSQLSSGNPHFKKVLIHRHHYIENYSKTSWGFQYNNARGVVPMHRDYARHYAINYVLDQGGGYVLTKWWDDQFNVIKEVSIRKGQWCILSTKILHGVENIEKGKNRVIIGLNWDPPFLENFDLKTEFNKFILD